MNGICRFTLVAPVDAHGQQSYQMSRIVFSHLPVCFSFPMLGSKLALREMTVIANMVSPYSPFFWGGGLLPVSALGYSSDILH